MKDENKLSIFQILIFALSIYVLVALAVSVMVKLPAEIEQLLEYIDLGICIIFLIDFAIRFAAAESKLKFMKWGWIDLLSSIPAVDYLRGGRILRLIRLLRLFRAFKSTKMLVDYLFKNKVQGAFTTAALIGILMIIFSSLAILLVETDANSNIKTAEDALWWSYVTITTVGYGDKFPVTTEGRIIAAALMTVGVGLFGIFAGFIASLLIEKPERKDETV